MENLTLSVKEIIMRGDVEKATEMIRQIENMIDSNTSSLGYISLKNLINTLKRFCAKKLRVELSNTDLKETLTVNTPSNLFEGNQNKKVISGLSKATIEDIKCEDIEISECNDIDGGFIDCENTILVREVRNARFKTKAKYIRLLSCFNMTFDITSPVDIFLQETSGVEITSSTGSDELWSSIHVYDFNNPIKSLNYKIIR